MNRWLLTAAALAALAAPAARAQYFPPVGAGLYGPLVPPAGGYNPSISGVYSGLGGFGYPGLGGFGYPGMYPGMGYGPGMVGAMARPGFGGPGLGPGMYTGRQLQLGAGQGLGDVNEDITGHPTRFNSYSQYFFNQGGSTYTTTPTGALSVYGLTGTDGRRNTGVGAPQQGSGGGMSQPPLVKPNQ